MPMKVVICNPLTQAAVQKYHHVYSHDFIKYLGLYGQSINHPVAMNSSRDIHTGIYLKYTLAHLMEFPYHSN